MLSKKEKIDAKYRVEKQQVQIIDLCRVARLYAVDDIRKISKRKISTPENPISSTSPG